MSERNGRIISINTSKEKGQRKVPVKCALLVKDFGIDGDAHASGQWHRQVSLLALESIKKMQAAGLDVDCGDFAENITTEGIPLPTLPIGTRMSIGESVELEVTQIGKECHNRCAIYYQAGDCVMPSEGIFVRVTEGGKIMPGDKIIVHGNK
ncbi:MAG: MOSC domain-containing protein [Nitrospirae bacterium]|nr:MOSC domain-containing protein [Nitrospirota bacterium]